MELRLNDVLAEIRSRHHREAAALRQPWPRIVRPPAPMRLDAYDSLHTTCRDLSHQVGDLPLVPDTVRGRVGILAVKLIRRCLFWYSGPLVLFHAAAVALFDEVRRGLGRLNQALSVLFVTAARTEELERRLAMLAEQNGVLERELRLLRQRLEERETLAR